MRVLRIVSWSAFAGFLALVLSAGVRGQDWRTASHEPVGLAPDPLATTEPVVQVYAARTWGWRGTFGVHTWVAVKPANAKTYTVYEVIGWRMRWSESALAISERAPDARVALATDTSIEDRANRQLVQGPVDWRQAVITASTTDRRLAA